MKRIGLILLAVFFISTTYNLWFTTFSHAAEQLEIVTYYPAPYGVYQQFRVTHDGTADDFIVDADGEVGIGIADPDAALHITGNNSPKLKIDGTASSGVDVVLNAGASFSKSIVFSTADSNKYQVGITNMDGDFDIRFITAQPFTGVSEISIDSVTGNVGIGTRNANAQLQVNGAISRNGTSLLGTQPFTHVNLGRNSTTGTAAANDLNCSIGGGENNTATGDWATVGAGRSNQALQESSTVAGGSTNTADGVYAIVGGGYGNNASANNATICGGHTNTAGAGCFVGGGRDNSASGSAATIPGGMDNTASGDYSFAAGRRAKAEAQGSFVWADSTDIDFTCNTADQIAIRANGGYLFKGLPGNSGGTHWMRYDSGTGLLSYWTSSIRYKENITTFTDNFYKILKLAPKSFTIKDTNKQSFGYIAEDLDSIGLNKLVVYDKEGRPDSIMFENIPIYIIEILKDKETQIASLVKEVNILKDKYNEMDKKLNALRKSIKTSK